MTIYFVDFENTQHIPELNNTKEDKVILFLGIQHTTLKTDLVKMLLTLPEVEIIQINRQGKNCLDFHICFYIGVIHKQENVFTDFVIVSNDKGFDPLVEHLNQINRNCRRIERNTIEPAKDTIPAKVSKKSKVKETPKIIKQPKVTELPKEIEPVKTIELFENIEQSIDIESPILIEPANIVLLNKEEEELVVKLFSLTPKKRPKTKKTLINMLKNISQSKGIKINMLEYLINEKYLVLEKEKVTYLK